MWNDWQVCSQTRRQGGQGWEEENREPGNFIKHLGSGQKQDGLSCAWCCQQPLERGQKVSLGQGLQHPPVGFLGYPMDMGNPISMGFSRQEYWSGVSLPSPCLSPLDSKLLSKVSSLLPNRVIVFSSETPLITWSPQITGFLISFLPMAHGFTSETYTGYNFWPVLFSTFSILF